MSHPHRASSTNSTVNQDDDEDEIVVPSRRRQQQKSRGISKVDDDIDATGSTTTADAAGNGSNSGYSWEDEYRRSWDIVQEDESGSIASLVSGLVDTQRKRSHINATPFQRGIIRTVVLVLDCSQVMREKDFRPNRHSLTVKYAVEFVHDFFEENPISQLAVVAMRNGLAHCVSPMSGNPSEHVDALHTLGRVDPEGGPSLQNALEMARGLLAHTLGHATREIVLVFGALFTADAGDIHATINRLAKEKVAVRVIGLAARVAVCEELVRATNANANPKDAYNVVLNETHFRELVQECVAPLGVPKDGSTDAHALVKMGFPSRVAESSPTLCACHSQLVCGGYTCPQCTSRVCALPAVCPSCGLTLVLSTHLARSYHHLFPLKLFVESPAGNGGKPNGKAKRCFACAQVPLTSYTCSDCHNTFCTTCDVFIHETLHICPGCESRPSH